MPEHRGLPLGPEQRRLRDLRHALGAIELDPRLGQIPRDLDAVALVGEPALQEPGGDLDQAATALGVSRTTFWRMRKRAGLI